MLFPVLGIFLLFVGKEIAIEGYEVPEEEP
jgi:hypothetical protein